MNRYIQDLHGKNYVDIGTVEEFFDCPGGVDDDAPPVESKRESLRKRMEPWLSAALQTDYVSVLLGSGFTAAVCGIAGVKAAGMELRDFGEYDAEINRYSEKTAKKMGRGEPNLEDQLRSASILLQGYEMSDAEGTNVESDYAKLGKAVDGIVREFAGSILSTERGLMEAIAGESKKGRDALSALTSFLGTFACRTATRERTHIFTTNYDRLVEYGCDMAGIKMIDGFWGKVVPQMDGNPTDVDIYYHARDSKNEFRYAEAVVRYSKIHGSIDWYEYNDTVLRDLLRFGADETGLPRGLGFSDHLMIYPNSMKAVETDFYPYSELFRDFSGAVCRPNSTLFVYGYGFGDTHVNKIMTDMLKIPSSHLVIISYDADERLMNFLGRVNRAQVSLLAGPEFARMDKLVRYYLPKPAIDTLSSAAGKMMESRKLLDDGQRGVDAVKEEGRNDG